MVVNAAIKDFKIGVQGLKTAAELLVLTADQDGVAQISSRVIKLGKTCLDAVTLEVYRTEIMTWRQALSPQAQIWLYGHSLAIGTKGMALVGRLSQLTGAVVAPSGLPIHASRRFANREANLELVPLASSVNQLSKL